MHNNTDIRVGRGFPAHDIRCHTSCCRGRLAGRHKKQDMPSARTTGIGQICGAWSGRRPAYIIATYCSLGRG